MFALTALHIAFCRPARRDEYHAIADRHYERALALFTPEVANIRSENCYAVMVAVQLICFISCARGPQPGEYLAFGDHGKSDWLVMFRGIRTTTENVDMQQFAMSHILAVRANGRPLPLSDEPFEYKTQLRELRDYVAFLAQPSECEEYVHAADILHECYVNRYTGVDGEYHMGFTWLYQMTDEFLERLQRHDVIPLILYAHFVVLMHDMERFWYLRGWTHHVMRGIYEALPAENKSWIRWPMAMVGWIAP